MVSAKPDAPLGEGEFEVVGTAELGKTAATRSARGGVIVWDTTNTNAISRLTRSLVMAVREAAPFALTAQPTTLALVQGEPIELTVAARRRPDMPSAIELNGAGYQLPPGMEIAKTTIPEKQTDAKLKLDSAKIPPGTYSFLVNGEAQVPIKEANGNSKNVRCVYPSNTVTLTVRPKPVAGKK